MNHRIGVFLGVDNPHKHVHVAHHAGGELTVGGGDGVEVGHVQQNQAAGAGAGFAAAHHTADAVEEARCRLGHRVGGGLCARGVVCLSLDVPNKFCALGVHAVFDAQPVQQFVAVLGTPDGGLHRGSRGTCGRRAGDGVPSHGIEERGLAAAGRTEESDDGVFSGELTAAAQAFEGLGGFEHHGFGEAVTAVAQRVVEARDGPREG